MKKLVKTIIDNLDEGFEIHGKGVDNYVTNVKSVGTADEFSLVWINPERQDKESLLANTKSKVIFGDHSLSLNEADFNNKVLIRVKNPKLAFIKILNILFVDKPEYGIDPTAKIHPEAKISDNVYIGAHTYIGRSEVKEGTIIYGNVYIYDNVSIGKNVTIEAGCSIGSGGFNFAKDENGKLHKFPHLGGVVIKDNVEIQAMSVIDRGVFDDTIIGEGTKIDSCCFIAHNCNIGENNAIIAHTVLSGSVKTGKNCWFAPGTIVRDQLSIGDDSFIGIGSLVINNLEKDSKVMGSPARPINEMKKLMNYFKTFINNEK